MKFKCKYIIMLLFIVICLPFILVGCNNKSSKEKYDSNIENFTFSKTEDNTGYIVNSYDGNSDYVKIPEKYNNLPVKEIGNRAFYLLKIYKAIIPDSIEIIREDAFGGCSNLVEINLPINLKTIKDRAFSGCTRISKIIVPDSVIEVGTSAFLSCLRVSIITIGRNSNSISSSAFSSTAATTVIIKSENVFKSLNDITSCGSLIENATIIKVPILIETTATEYIQTNYTETISEGYRVFTKNT